MTVTATVKKAIEGTVWVHLAGTIAEVLQELADESVTASKTVWYYDGGTNAIAVYCKTA